MMVLNSSLFLWKKIFDFVHLFFSVLFVLRLQIKIIA